jgi:aerobic carbon-monoxide dehydrogenase small subunit
MQVSLTVNHQPFTVDVEPRLLLVDLLRDVLGFTGAKVGCDTGQCGACVVLMDGVSVKSCALFAVQADGANITTVEGVAEKGHLNPLQAGFQAMHAVQCGFCTPGMVMSMTDLMERNPDPSEAEIRAWLAGNLCRCTGYENVVRAVQAARRIAENPAKILPDSPHKLLYEQHIIAMQSGDLDGLVQHYSDGAVLTTFEGVFTGRDALRSYYQNYLNAQGGVQILSTEKFIELNNAFYIEATVRSGHGVTHVYNSFVVQDGKITHQFAGVK